MRSIPIFILAAALSVAGCDNTSPSKTATPAAASEQKEPLVRNESFAQVSQGAVVFKENCQVCHGVAAAGVVKDWQKADANGNLPAPPLNGTAHAWHHDQVILLRTINKGGAELGGSMPPFKDVLTEAEKLAAIAYIKSLWPDELYAAWQERFGGK